MSIEQLLRDPDAQVLRRGMEIAEFLPQFTVPLFIFDGPVDRANYRERGSGVLIKLWDRYFVATVGHVVTAMQRIEPSALHLSMTIANSPHIFEVRVAKAAGVYEPSTGLDYGYAEIVPMDATVIESKAKVFAGPNRLLVLRASEIATADDWMIIAGYPRATSTETPAGLEVKLLHVISTIAGKRSAPASPSPVSSSTELIDIWVPRMGMIDTMSSEFGEVPVPLLSGASGGGLWKTQARNNAGNWQPDQMQLVGLHSGSTEEHIINGEKHIFCREVAVGHVLHKIAEDYADLSVRMKERWPDIESYRI